MFIIFVYNSKYLNNNHVGFKGPSTSSPTKKYHLFTDIVS